MSSVLTSKLAVAAVLALTLPVAVAALFFWLRQNEAVELSVRTAGKDGRPVQQAKKEQPVDFSNGFSAFDGLPASLPGSWPCFRGAAFDNIAHEAPPLAETWGPEGPPVLWTIPLGEGYAGPVVLNGRVYVLDYIEDQRADALRCFSLEDGREIWRYAYEVEVVRNHGMSRTTPAVTDSHVVSIGPRCHVLCLDSQTGAFRWGLDLQREYGAQEPLWYTGQCPVIDRDCAIVAPAAPDALLMAVSLSTGQVIWRTSNPRGWQMSHSSVAPMTLAGKRMYVYAAIGGISGISAEEGDWGTLLWQTPWDAKVVAPTPVAIGGDRILALAGYGAGGMVLEVRRTAAGFEGVEISRHSPRDGVASEQHTPVVYEGHIYAIMPKDAGALRAQFVCYRPDGTLVWASGQERRFGLGPWLLADGKFFVLDDGGVLYLVRATPERFELLGQAQVLQGHESWAPLALAHDRLLARDSTSMACLQVGK